MNGSRYRLGGGGQKLTDNELEEQVLSWIHEGCANMLCVSRKLIMFKAKSIYIEKCGNNKAMKDVFIVSNGWLEKFISCNNLLQQRKTIAQKYLSHYTDKLVGYGRLVQRLTMKRNYPSNCIIATDETAVWLDMVANNTVNTTRVKDTPLKSTGTEKRQVSVCWTAKANGTKTKPFVVFHCAKQEAVASNENFKHC